MKIFSSELGSDYSTLTFGYAQYCLSEPNDALAGIYEKGYLPYSAVQDTTGIFYFARSARVLLETFALTSENRRIAKKFDGLFEKKRIPLSKFSITEEFRVFWLDYFEKKHGNVMPRERLQLILNFGLISTVVEYRKDGAPVGYVLEVEDNGIAHYWYSAYDLSLAKQSLGMWMMLDCVRDAKDRGLNHYYLGTVYGEKALYKTNFEPLEWWDGETWQSDIKLLRERGRTDGSRLVPLMDVWKGNQKLF